MADDLTWTDTALAPEVRAELLLDAMTLEQKMQQLTGALPEVLPELPTCLGARHVTGIAELGIPTLRITNGPVGVGQNDCVDPSIFDDPAKGNGTRRTRTRRRQRRRRFRPDRLWRHRST